MIGWLGDVIGDFINDVITTILYIKIVQQLRELRN